jgi:site-specific DNA recombinase
MAFQSGDEEPRSSTSTLRCAIYTRKSTEEGLNQDFNTLEAQREAAEAYIRSQLHAGWIVLAERYDDGGYTGANLERPALRRLLADIAAGRIDCVMVYKVDRLSRSLLDFARLMEIFERRQVSLVSITQPLNTTSSLGRLTLNILLSFAEFERQMIADRTRDKMAAARRKGKWVGGTPVLGYDIVVGGGKLVVNPEEARRVQEIFALYLQHRSLDGVLDEMENRQWTTKRWRTRDGQEHPGRPFTKATPSRLRKKWIVPSAVFLIRWWASQTTCEFEVRKYLSMSHFAISRFWAHVSPDLLGLNRW